MTSVKRKTTTNVSLFLRAFDCTVIVYVDASSVVHSHVRAADGTVTTFDAPGAGAGSGQGTVPEGINPAGTIIGQYVDSSGANHGYVRTSHDAIGPAANSRGC